MYPLTAQNLHAIADALEFFQLHSDDESLPATVSLFPNKIRVFYGGFRADTCGELVRDYYDYASVEEMLTAIDGTANVQRLIIGRETLGIAAFT